MGFTLGIPFYAVLAFCTLALVLQGLMLGDEFEDAVPDAPTLDGNFFQDVGDIGGFVADVFTFIAQFLSFDLFPAIPWWVQFPLAILCNGVFVIALVMLSIRGAEALGALLPFT